MISPAPPLTIASYTTPPLLLDIHSLHVLCFLCICAYVRMCVVSYVSRCSSAVVYRGISADVHVCAGTR